MNRNWNTAWIERTIGNMDDLQTRGEEEITLHIREFQHILMQLLAAHQRCDRLEDVLCSYAKYAFPVTQQLINPPAMFGGNWADSNTLSRTVSGSQQSQRLVLKTPIITEVPKEPPRQHFYLLPRGRDYSICTRCDLSDVYVNAFNVPCKP